MIRIALAAVAVAALGAFTTAAPSTPLGDETRPLGADDDDLPPSMKAALAKTINVDFDGVPLKDAVAQVAQQAGVEISFDRNALDEAKVDVGRSVIMRFKSQPLLLALELLLKPLELQAEIRGSAIRISTLEQSRRANVIRIHPVADLVLNTTGGWIDPDGAVLTRLIEDSVDRDVWEPNGGDATIQFYRPSIGLIVNAPSETHEKAHRMLALLRRSREQTARLMERHDLGTLEDALADADNVSVPPLGLFRPPAYPPAADVISSMQSLAEARATASEALSLAKRLEEELNQLKKPPPSSPQKIPAPMQ